MDLIELHLSKAKRNEELHLILVANEPDRLFDWKIVALFYAALHYLKALSSKRNIDIGETHYDIDFSCDPDKPMSVMPITRNAWFHYKNLLYHSKESRYSVMDDQTKTDYEYCLEELNRFKKYIKGQGLPIIL